VRRRYTIQTIYHIDKRNEPTLHLIFVTQLEFSFSLKSFAEVSNDKLSNGGSLFRPNYQDDQFIQTFHVTSQYLVGSHLCFCKGTIFSFSNTYIFSVKIFIVFLPFMSRKSQNISARICPNTFNHNMRELSHRESTRLFKRRSQYGRSQHLKKIASPGPLPSRQRSLLLPATRLESVKYRVLDFTLPEFILHAVSPLKSWLCDYSLPAWTNSKFPGSGEEHWYFRSLSQISFWTTERVIALYLYRAPPSRFSRDSSTLVSNQSSGPFRPGTSGLSTREFDRSGHLADAINRG